MTNRELIAQMARDVLAKRAKAAETGLKLKPLSGVVAEAVDWLWPGRVPLGMLTMLDGDPGLGKSSVAFDLAARLTLGAPVPLATDQKCLPIAGVLLICAEDSAAHTLRPRMEAIGADLARVFLLTDAVVFPGDLPAIEELVKANGVKLVVIDPVMSFLGSGVDSNSDQSARQALTPLKLMAERTGAAVILIRHLNKNSGHAAAYRGGGSIAFNAAARSALIVGRDPDKPTGSVLASVKCNVGPRPDPVSYTIGEYPMTLPGGRVVGMPVVEWGELRPGLTPDDIMTRPELRDPDDAPSKLDAAADFLKRELEGSAVAKTELESRAIDEGINWRSVERASEKLGVVKERATLGGRSSWALPAG